MEPGASELRRSARERRATTVKYNGFAVKVNNQYTLQEGERSVFDEELGDIIKTNSKLYDKPLPKKTAAPRQARALTAEEKIRQAQNQQLQAITSRLEQRRRYWLRCHLSKLEGWVPDKELNKLRADHSLMHAPEPTQRLDCQPSSIRGNMKEYQLKGIAFMARMVSDGVGCILADEMGLGKTLQTIALIAWMKIHQKEPGPCLVVVPLSVISSWIGEFKKWCPQLNVARLHSSDQSYHRELARTVLTVGADSPDVVLTTYDMVKSMNVLSMKLYWRLLVLDEGHLIKNDQTGRAAALRRVRACSTVLLTGTPLQNNLVELWALLSFLNPVFSDSTPFESAFKLGANEHNADKEALDGAHKLLSLFCLRRVKREVEVSLPPLIETRVECPLSSLQTFWYRRLLLREYQTLLKKVEAEEGGDAAPAPAAQESAPEAGAWKKLQALFIQLRKCCNHPYLFPSAEPDFDGSTGEDLVQASGKLAVLDRLLTQLYAGGHRVVLFSQFKMMLDIFEDMLQMRGYDGKYMRLDGSTGRVQRTVDIAEFNRKRKDGSEPPFLFMLCTRAGGLGVNLQTADTVILYDSDWNPQVDLQAIARVHRIGQKNPVAALRLVTAGSVEQRMVERAEKKLYLDAMVSRGSTAEAEAREKQADDKGVENKELLGALMFGTDRLFSTDSGAMPTDEELAALLVSARDPTSKANANMASVKKTAEEFEAKSGYSVEASSEARNELILKAMGSEAEKLGMKKGISDKDIARQAAQAMETKAALQTDATKRESKARLVDVKDDRGHTHKVLRSNMYSLEQGEPSVMETEAKPVPGAKKTSSRQIAGKDYPHSEVCQVCWEKEDYWEAEFGVKKSTFLKCRGCPVSAHLKCIEEYENASTWVMNNSWTCPHHRCEACNITASAAGGLLFRCECCWRALCEDHLPQQAEHDSATEDGWHPVGRCERFEALGQRHPQQAYFITCDPDCRKYCEENVDLFRVKPKEQPTAAPVPPPGSPGVPMAPPEPTVITHTPKTASLAALAKGSKRKSPKASPAAGRVKPVETHTPTSVKASRAQRALKRSASDASSGDTIDFEKGVKAARLHGAKEVACADAPMELPMVSEENEAPRTEAEEGAPEAMAVEAAETKEGGSMQEAEKAAETTEGGSAQEAAKVSREGVTADGGEGVPASAEPTMGTKRLSQIFSSPPTASI